MSVPAMGAGGALTHATEVAAAHLVMSPPAIGAGGALDAEGARRP